MHTRENHNHLCVCLHWHGENKHFWIKSLTEEKVGSLCTCKHQELFYKAEQRPVRKTHKLVHWSLPCSISSVQYVQNDLRVQLQLTSTCCSLWHLCVINISALLRRSWSMSTEVYSCQLPNKCSKLDWNAAFKRFIQDTEHHELNWWKFTSLLGWNILKRLDSTSSINIVVIKCQQHNQSTFL